MAGEAERIAGITGAWSQRDFSPSLLSERLSHAAEINPFVAPTTSTDAWHILLAQAVKNDPQVATIGADVLALRSEDKQTILQHALVQQGAEKFFDATKTAQLATILQVDRLVMLVSHAVRLPGFLEHTDTRVTHKRVEKLLQVSTTIAKDKQKNDILPAMMHLAEAGFYPEWYVDENGFSYEHTKKIITSQKGLLAESDFLQFCQALGSLLHVPLSVNDATTGGILEQAFYDKEKQSWMLYAADMLFRRAEPVEDRMALFAASDRLAVASDAVAAIQQQNPLLQQMIASDEFDAFITEKHPTIVRGADVVAPERIEQFLHFYLDRKLAGSDALSYWSEKLGIRDTHMVSLDTKLLMLEDVPERRAVMDVLGHMGVTQKDGLLSFLRQQTNPDVAQGVLPIYTTLKGHYGLPDRASLQDFIVLSQEVQRMQDGEQSQLLTRLLSMRMRDFIGQLIPLQEANVQQILELARIDNMSKAQELREFLVQLHGGKFDPQFAGGLADLFLVHQSKNVKTFLLQAGLVFKENFSFSSFDLKGLARIVKRIPVASLPELARAYEEVFSLVSIPTNIPVLERIEQQRQLERKRAKFSMAEFSEQVEFLYVSTQHKDFMEDFANRYRFPVDPSTIYLLSDLIEHPDKEIILLALDFFNELVPFTLTENLFSTVLTANTEHIKELLLLRDAITSIFTNTPLGQSAAFKASIRRGSGQVIAPPDMLFTLFASENPKETIGQLLEKFDLPEALLNPKENIELDFTKYNFSDYPVDSYKGKPWASYTYQELFALLKDGALVHKLRSGELTTVRFGSLPSDTAKEVFVWYTDQVRGASADRQAKQTATQRNNAFAASHGSLTPDVLAGLFIHVADNRSFTSIYFNGLLPSDTIREEFRRGGNSFAAHVSLGEVMAVESDAVIADQIKQSLPSNFAAFTEDSQRMFLLFDRAHSTWESGKLIRKGHPLMLGGMPATEIQCIILRDSQVAQRMQATMIAQNLYIPLYDIEGKLLFTPESFQRGREAYDIQAAVYPGKGSADPERVQRVIGTIIPDAKEAFAGPNGRRTTETLGEHTLLVGRNFASHFAPTWQNPVFSSSDMVLLETLHDIGKPLVNAGWFSSQTDANVSTASGYLEQLQREGLQISPAKARMLVHVIGQDILGDFIKKRVSRSGSYTQDERNKATILAAQEIRDLVGSMQQEDSAHTAITLPTIMEILLTHFACDASAYAFIRQDVFTEDVKYNSGAWNALRELLQELQIPEEAYGKFHE